MSSNPYRIDDVLGLLPYTKATYTEIADRGYAYPELQVPTDSVIHTKLRATRDTLPNVEEYWAPDTVHAYYIAWYPDKASDPKWYYPFISPARTLIEALLAWYPDELFKVRQVRVTGYIRKEESWFVQQYDLLSPVLGCQLLRITKANILRVRLSYQDKAWITEVTANRLVNP